MAKTESSVEESSEEESSAEESSEEESEEDTKKPAAETKKPAAATSSSKPAGGKPERLKRSDGLFPCFEFDKKGSCKFGDACTVPSRAVLLACVLRLVKRFLSSR
jgi:hypothetical protein